MQVRPLYRQFVALLALVMVLLLSACVQPAPAASTTETTAGQAADYPPLHIITSFKISSLDPIDQGFWMSEFGSAELMMKWDRDFVLKPWVLKSLDQIDDLNWRLTLRPNVTFQNGKPLTAIGLAALINRQLKLSSSAQADLPGASAKETSDTEVVLTTTTPNPAVPNILAQEGVFPVYDVDAVEAVGDDYSKLAGAGFYTGPYAPVSLNDQELVMERYEGYWQGKPPLPSVTVGFIADAQARILAVQNGEADIALYVPSEAKTILAGRSDAYFVTAPNTREGVLLIFNLKQPPFDDAAVRRAFSFGVDYASIANDVLNGVYQVATGYYPEGFPWLVKNEVYDPAKAKQLLDEAGWVAGADGMRTKDGQPLKVTLLIYPQQPDLVPMSTAIQAELKEVGFDVEIQSLDDLDEAMQSNLVPWNIGLTFDGAIDGGGGLQLHRYVASTGDRNYGGINDPKLDALISQAYATFDQNERNDLLQQIQKILVEDNAYQLYIANKLFPAVVSPAYKNYLPSHNWDHVNFETKPSE